MYVGHRSFDVRSNEVTRRAFAVDDVTGELRRCTYLVKMRSEFDTSELTNDLSYVGLGRRIDAEMVLAQQRGKSRRWVKNNLVDVIPSPTWVFF